MMRPARYTGSLMTDIQTGIPISIRSEATGMTSKHRLVSERIPRATARTRQRRIGRAYEPNRHPCYGSQQQNALCKESRAPLSPPWETVRLFKRNASTSPTSTAHQVPGFSGLRLSLRGHFIGPIPPLLLVKSTPVALSFQYRAQVVTSVAVRAGHCSSYAHITPDKLSSREFVRQRDFHAYPTVPLTVLPEDFALFTERGSWVGQGSVDRPMLAGRDIQLPHTLHHDPQVKALGLAWLLDVACINQLSFENGSLEWGASLPRRLETALPVRMSPAIRPSCKLSHPSAWWDTGLLHSRNRMCGKRVQPTKQPRQESQCVRLIGRRVQLKLIGKSNRLACHSESVTQNPPPCKVSFAPINRGDNGPLRLRLGGLRKSAPSGHADFEESANPDQEEYGHAVHTGVRPSFNDPVRSPLRLTLGGRVF